MKAIISGAGIAGLAAAKFLGDRGWEIVVVEHAAGLRAAGYVIDFFGSGFDAFSRAGLIESARAKQQSIRKLEYVGSNGRARSSIDYGTFVTSLDGKLISILRGDLERVLYDSLPATTKIIYSATIKKILQDDEGVRATLQNGESLEADLLIGADGIHSNVRSLVFGPESEFLRYLGYQVAAFLFEDPGLVRELDGTFRMLTVPNRQMGVFATDATTIAAFFAFTAPEQVRPNDPVAAVSEIYQGLGWIVPEVIERMRAADDIYYDVMAQIEMESWHKGRTVLVGDAAYAVSLLAGQGASMAVGGAYVLAEQLSDLGIDEAFKNYDSEVRPLIVEKQLAGRRTANWFVPPTEFHNIVRDIFLNVARAPGLSVLLKNFFAPSLKSVIRERH